MSRGVAFLLLLALLLLPAAAGAAPVGIGRQDGLPSNGATALAWDGTALWVGTLAGLGRIERSRAVTVPLPLDEQEVSVLAWDGTALWVGTPAGLARWRDGAWQVWNRLDDRALSGWITALAVHDGRLVVGTRGAGLFARDGEGWRALPGGPARVTALADDGPRLAVGTDRGLWFWQEEVWTRDDALGDFAVNDLVVGGDLLVAATEQGGLLSRRRGRESWESNPVPAPAGPVALTPGGPRIASEGRLYTIEGRVEPGLPRAPIQALLAADGRLWIAMLGAGVVALPAAPIEPPPRPPVLLLAGLGDGPTAERSNLRFLAEWLKRDGHSVDYFAYDAAQPLLTHIAALRNAIDAAGQGEPVLIIAHSYGGLVAQSYLASGGTGVGALVTLGTPHAGLHLAYSELLRRLEGPDDVRADLLPAYAALVAPYRPPTTPPHLAVAGDRLPDALLLAALPPSDGLVSTGSAAGPATATVVAPVVHGWTDESLALGVDALTWPDGLYLRQIRPWLQGVSPESPAAPIPLPPVGQSRTLLWDGSLASGQEQGIEVALDGSPVTWLLDGEGLTLELIAPDGRRFAADRPLLTDEVAHLPAIRQSLLSLDLWSTATLPGLWRAVLTNPTPSRVRGTLTLVDPTRPPLELSLQPRWSPAGAPIEILVEGPADAAVVVEIAGQQIPLQAVEPGRYRARIAAPAAPGYHPVRVSAGGQERWTTAGVYAPGFTVHGAGVVPRGDGSALRLAVDGEGRVAVGWRLLDGEQVVAARLAGPYRLRGAGRHALTVSLPPLDTSGLRLEWLLFDARGTLIPVVPSTDPEPLQ